MTEFNGIFRWVYLVGDWIFKFMFLHFLWVFFTLLGLGVFGIAPATCGLFSVIEKWLSKDPDTPVFRSFFDTYKKEFLKSNALSVVIISISAFLYVDFMISKKMIQSFFIHIMLIILIILFFLILLYIYPVFVRYNLKFFHYFKQPFLIALAQPLETFGMISWVVFIVSIFFHIPIVFIFSGSTLLAYPISWLALHAFKKIEAKKVV